MGHRGVRARGRPRRAVRARPVRQPGDGRRVDRAGVRRRLRVARAAQRRRRRAAGGRRHADGRPSLIDLRGRSRLPAAPLPHDARPSSARRRRSGAAAERSDRSSIERADGELLGVWQDVSAVGFDVAEGDARRVSDAFATAAAVVDGPGFLLARDAADGTSARAAPASRSATGWRRSGRCRRCRRSGDAACSGRSSPTGCGSLQSRLRPRRVLDRCPANASERNLVRAGFRPLYETVTLARAPRGSGSS